MAKIIGRLINAAGLIVGVIGLWLWTALIGVHYSRAAPGYQVGFMIVFVLLLILVVVSAKGVFKRQES